MAKRYNMMHPRKDETAGKTYWDPIGVVFANGDIPEDAKIWGRLNTGCEFNVFPATKPGATGSDSEFQ
jgi:hypothetical protein